MPAQRALVLFSGGLDSTTVLHVARERGFDPLALLFRYGQRHSVEIDHALALLGDLGVEHRIETLDLRAAGGSALTSEAIDVPTARTPDEIADAGVPVTYVPARNTIFLAHALAWAEVEGIDDVFLGINAVDYSGYPDCRPEFLRAFEALAQVACRSSAEEGRALRFHAPLIDKTKSEIIHWGTKLGVDYSRTWSCYSPRLSSVPRRGTVVREPSGSTSSVSAQAKNPREETARWVACGECDSCALRAKGFRDAGVADPTEYS